MTIVPLNIPRARARALRALLGPGRSLPDFATLPEMHRTVDCIVRDCALDAAVVYSLTMAQFVPVDFSTEPSRTSSTSIRRSGEITRVSEPVPLESRVCHGSHSAGAGSNAAARVAVPARDRQHTPRTGSGKEALAGGARTAALVNGLPIEAHFRPEPSLEGGLLWAATSSSQAQWTTAPTSKAVRWFCENVRPKLSNSERPALDRRPSSDAFSETVREAPGMSSSRVQCPTCFHISNAQRSWPFLFRQRVAFRTKLT